MRKDAKILPALLGFFIIAAPTVSCSKGPAIEESTHGESILDRVVHIEPALVTSIPATFRWCDRLPGLDKRRIDVGGAELYVELEGKGVPLVLINGGPGGTHHYFHPWFSRAKKYARVVYYDQRGCGLSDFKPGDKGYSVEQAVEDLEAIRKSLGFEKWVVLGYSYGGFLAQLYTVLHPENVSGLVLLGASPGMRTDDGPSREDEFISEAEKKRMTEVRRELNEYAKANNLPRQKVVELSIYNNFLNGDWKRQNFYRPSPDRLAQGALYEWVHDQDFNSVMGQTARPLGLHRGLRREPDPDPRPRGPIRPDLVGEEEGHPQGQPPERPHGHLRERGPRHLRRAARRVLPRPQGVHQKPATRRRDGAREGIGHFSTAGSPP